jgi:hypothetical protein
VGPRAGLDILEKEKSLASAGIHNPDYPAYSIVILTILFLINTMSHEYVCVSIHLLDINETLYKYHASK